MMKKVKIIIITLLLSSAIYAQEVGKDMVENPRVKRPFGLSLYLIGPTNFISGSVDYFILPVLNIEAGGGYWGYYGGVKYHLNGYSKRDKYTPYIGVIFNAIPPSEANKWPAGGDGYSFTLFSAPKK